MPAASYGQGVAETATLFTEPPRDAAPSAASLSQIRAQPHGQGMVLDPVGPTGLTPEQILNAYGINQITFSDGTIAGNGSGQTIAIVDPYDDPNIGSDLATFDQQFGLPAPPSFHVDNLGGTMTDPGWAVETSLDVEWTHAIAPGANIVLVEASSDRLGDLFNAVDQARSLPGVSVVSVSWGAEEAPEEAQVDSLFTTPAGHNNVTFVAASGDKGALDGLSYPSVSPNVLAVGGTTLTLGPGNTYGFETAWSGSTGGFSADESEPPTRPRPCSPPG
jgi:subtilase family serine protease